MRDAELTDIKGAGDVRASVLSERHPHYEQNIGKPETLNLVAEEDGVVVGFVSVLLSKVDPNGPDVWWRVAQYLAFIGVKPAKQRRGIGRSLLHFAIRETVVRCPNETTLYLEHEADSEARRLYERFGFKAMSDQEV